MTEIEKFNEEVEKRVDELQKMYRKNPSKYEKLKYELAKKYGEMLGEGEYFDSPAWGLSPIEQWARIDVAVKMGKLVSEITGMKYDPNVIY